MIMLMSREHDTSMIMPLEPGMPAWCDFYVQGGNRMAAIAFSGFEHDKGMIMPWSMRAWPCRFPSVNLLIPNAISKQAELDERPHGPTADCSGERLHAEVPYLVLGKVDCRARPQGPRGDCR